MDVHAETLAAAIAEPDGEVRSFGTIPNRLESVRKLLKNTIQSGRKEERKKKLLKAQTGSMSGSRDYADKMRGVCVRRRDGFSTPALWAVARRCKLFILC